MANHPNPFTASPFAPKPPMYGSSKTTGTATGHPAGGTGVGGGGGGGNLPQQPNGGPVRFTPPGSSGGGHTAPPDGGTTGDSGDGPIHVGGSGGDTNPPPASAPPTISKAYAAQDGTGTSSLFSVTGTGLSGAHVEIDGIAAAVTQNNATIINGHIPAGVDTGMVPITVTNSAGSASATITIKAPKPSITAVSPASGDVSGTQISITGGGLAAASAVIIGGAQAEIGSNTATSIVATVPTTAKVGAGLVVVQTGAGSTSHPFTVTNAAGTQPPPNLPPPGGGPPDPTTASGWLAAIEIPGSPAAQAAYNAISTTGGAGLSLAELSQNVSMIAGEIGTNVTAASILAALASLGSSYLVAAAPGATFTAAQVFAAGNIGAGAQASLASEYNSAVTASNTGGTTITSTTGSSSGSGGGSTGGGAAPSAVDPATGQYYAYETDPATGLPYVIDPATGIPYTLETGIQGSNPGLPSTGSSSSKTPLVLLGLAGLAAFYFYEKKQKSQASPPSTP